jgi:hypothetical protein
VRFRWSRTRQDHPTAGIHHSKAVERYGLDHQRQARSVTIVVLAALAIVWAVVLGSYVKEKSTHRTGDTVSAFKDQLSTLQRTQPGYPARAASGAVPASSSRWHSSAARRRRRDILFGLIAVAATTFLLAAVTGSMPLIVLNILCDLAAAGYVALLVNQQRIVTEQRTKVRQIRPVQPARRPAQSAPAYRRPQQQVAMGGQRIR